MKRTALSRDLVPLDEFRDDVADWVSRPGETGRPVVLTDKGRAASVLVSAEMLDGLEEEREVVRLLVQGLREAAAGELVEDEEVWAAVEGVLARHGIDSLVLGLSGKREDLVP